MPYQSNRFPSERGRLSGDNVVAWQSCADEGTDPSLFTIHSVHIDPDPPQRTRKLRVRVTGHLQETLHEGYVRYTVRYNTLQVLTEQIDGCSKLHEEPTLPQCPIEAGAIAIDYTTGIPWFVPPGQYTVDIESRTRDNKRILCLRIDAPIDTPGTHTL